MHMHMQVYIIEYDCKLLLDVLDFCKSKPLDFWSLKRNSIALWEASHKAIEPFINEVFKSLFKSVIEKPKKVDIDHNEDNIKNLPH